MESVRVDDDCDRADSAEEDLMNCALRPFLPVFSQTQTTLSNQRHVFTLQDYLFPETCRYIFYVVNERLEPCFDFEVPRQPRANGVAICDLTLYPKWPKLTPAEIEICVSNHSEACSKLPRKVLAGGATCLFKPLDYNDRRAAIRELATYKQIEISGLSDKVRVPRLIGVAQDDQGSYVIGLLLSWVDCRNRSLECSLGPETPLTLRRKWDMQVTTTLDCLHKADIIWGDAKPANILIDINEDAWIIDFGGGYTRGWVEKEQMETVQGDEEGLSKIKQFLYGERSV
jgi:serine/threonine protein kinase